MGRWRSGESEDSIGSHLKKRGLKPTVSVDSLPGEVPDESAPASAGTYNNKFFDQGGAYSGLDHGMKQKLSETLGKGGSFADKEAFAHKFYDEGGEFSGLDHDMKGQIMGEWGDGPDSEPDGDPDDPAAALLAKKKAILARRMAEKQARQGRRADRFAPKAVDPTLSTDDPKYTGSPDPIDRVQWQDGNIGIGTGEFKNFRGNLDMLSDKGGYQDPRGAKYNPIPGSGGQAVPRGVGGGGGQMDPAKIQQIMQYLQMMGMK